MLRILSRTLFSPPTTYLQGIRPIFNIGPPRRFSAAVYKVLTVELFDFRTPFGECYKPVHCDVLEDIRPSAYPLYLDTIHLLKVS